MSDPTAVMGRRITAYIVDSIIALVFLLALVLPLWNDLAHHTIYSSSSSAQAACDALKGTNTFCVNAGSETWVLANDDFSQVQSRLFLVGSLVGILNHIVLQGLTGASVGKLLLGIRVVDGNTGQKAGWGKIIIRWLLLLLDAGCCIIGLVTSLSSKGHRRVGDMAASTNVVAASQVGIPPMAPVPMATGGWGAPPTTTPPPGWAPPSDAPAAGWGPTPGQGMPGAATPPAAPGDGSSPQWDEARKAYIQFDQARGAWLQFDDATQQWKPIDS